MKKIIIILALMLGCTKPKNDNPSAISHSRVNVNNTVGDTIPEPKKKGVCEGCSHQ